MSSLIISVLNDRTFVSESVWDSDTGRHKSTGDTEPITSVVERSNRTDSSGGTMMFYLGLDPGDRMDGRSLIRRYRSQGTVPQPPSVREGLKNRWTLLRNLVESFVVTLKYLKCLLYRW